VDYAKIHSLLTERSLLYNELVSVYSLLIIFLPHAIFNNKGSAWGYRNRSNFCRVYPISPRFVKRQNTPTYFFVVYLGDRNLNYFCAASKCWSGNRFLGD